MTEAIPWIGSTMFFAGVIVGFWVAMRVFGIFGDHDDDGDGDTT